MSAIVQDLGSLPASERHAALESIVVAEFKVTLLMPEDEDLPLTESYFELGLTSLGMTDVKQRLERLLDCDISTTVMFNSPTVEQLTQHLAAELFGTSAETAESGGQQDAAWDDMLRSLYE
jgi:acyl carrier protein